MSKIVVELDREAAALLLSRVRQMALANEAVALKYHEGPKFVNECKQRAETFGRIAAELDSKLEQPTPKHTGNVELLPAILQKQAG